MEIKPSIKPASISQVPQDQKVEVTKQEFPARVQDSYEQAKFVGEQPGGAGAAPELENKPDEISQTLLEKQLITARFQPPLKAQKGITGEALASSETQQKLTDAFQNTNLFGQADHSIPSPGSGKEPPQQSSSNDAADRLGQRIPGAIMGGLGSDTTLLDSGLLGSGLGISPQEIEEQPGSIAERGSGKTPPDKKLPEISSGKTPPVETDPKTLEERGSGKTPPSEKPERDIVAGWLATGRPVNEQQRIDIGGSTLYDHGLGAINNPSQDSSQPAAPVEYQDLNMNEDAKKRMELQKLLNSAPQNTGDETNRTPGKKREP